jgi:hypothetical protein
MGCGSPRTESFNVIRWT